MGKQSAQSNEQKKQAAAEKIGAVAKRPKKKAPRAAKSSILGDFFVVKFECEKNLTARILSHMQADT